MSDSSGSRPETKKHLKLAGEAERGVETARETQSNVTKVCELCGAEFGCGSTSVEPCWCLGLPVLTGKIEGANDCVCPECLQKLIARGPVR